MGHTADIVTLEDELVLSGLGKLNSASSWEVDEVTLLSTKEVLDFDLFLVLGDVSIDWEMCVNQSHFVHETL